MIIDTTLTRAEQRVQEVQITNAQQELRNFYWARWKQNRVRDANGQYADDYNEVLGDMDIVPCPECLSFRVPYWGLVSPHVILSLWESGAKANCERCWGTGVALSRESKNE